MRLALPLLLSLAFCTHASIAQRPWTFAYPDNTASTQQAIVSNMLFAYGDYGMSYSINHGSAWDTVVNVGTMVRGVTDFFSGVAICISQQPSADSASLYYSSNGTAWSFSESLNVGRKSVVGLSARGQQFYVVTTEGTIYVRGITLDSLVIPGATNITDFIVAPTYLAALSTAGIHYSSNEGASWTLTSTPQFQGFGVSTTDLLSVNSELFAATSGGVFLYQPSNNTRFSHGTWPDTVSSPNILAFAGDGLRMLAITSNALAQLQMYRVSSADTVWTETGWALPQRNIDPRPNMLAIDNGWAILHQTSVEPNDSLGFYNYDLNDFTSVDESWVDDGVKMILSSNVLTINTPYTTGFTLSVYDILGNLISTQTSSLQSSQFLPSIASHSQTSPSQISSTHATPLCLVITSNDGRIARRLIMW